MDLEPAAFAARVDVADRPAATLEGAADGRLGEGRGAVACGDLGHLDLHLEAVAPVLDRSTTIGTSSVFGEGTVS